MTDMPELRIFVASPPLALWTVAACVVNAALNAPSAVARSVIFCSCAALPASTALFLVWRLVTADCIAASVGLGAGKFALPVMAVMMFCPSVNFWGMLRRPRFNFTLAITFLAVGG